MELDRHFEVNEQVLPTLHNLNGHVNGRSQIKMLNSTESTGGSAAGYGCFAIGHGGTNRPLPLLAAPRLLDLAPLLPLKTRFPGWSPIYGDLFIGPAAAGMSRSARPVRRRRIDYSIEEGLSLSIDFPSIAAADLQPVASPYCKKTRTEDTI